MDRDGRFRDFYVEPHPDLVDRVNNWDPSSHLSGYTFEQAYAKGIDYSLKYSMAMSLIESPEYPDEKKAFLATSFINTKRIYGPNEIELKEALQYTLLEKGIIDPDSDDAEGVEHEILRRAYSDSEIRELVGEDLVVLGALTTLKLFSGLSDKQKIEKLRSRTTRAFLPAYLGEVEVHVPKMELEFRDYVLRFPDEIFGDPEGITHNIIRNGFECKAMRLFANSEESGFQELQTIIDSETSQARREFLIDLRDRFQKVSAIEIPPVFKGVVEGWFSDESPFPNFRQKHFVSTFVDETQKKWRDVLNGDTGATKTACAYLAMETAGYKVEDAAQRVTIIGPAKARNTWLREAEKIFLEDEIPEVFVVRKRQDLLDERVETAKYVYVSTEMLAKAWGDEAWYSHTIESLVDRRGTDAFIFDESDELRNPKNSRTQMAVDIVNRARAQYETHTIYPPMPMLALTATPISTSIKDMDVTMGLIYPTQFSLPGEDYKDRLVFSKHALDDPNIAHTLLSGDRLMTQWSLEDIFGDKAPKLEFERVALQLRPYQLALMDVVSNLPYSHLAKTRLVRGLILNPNLVKQTIRRSGKLPEPEYDEKGLEHKLYRLHEEWQVWLLNKDPRIPDESFSADWIAKCGEISFLSQCFFDDQLIDGIESYVGRFPEIYKDWEYKVDPSATYEYLRSLLREKIGTRNNLGSYKVFIVSPGRKQGVTEWSDELEGIDLEDDSLSLYEYLRLDWLHDLPEEWFANLDGNKDFEIRDRAAQKWREMGNINKVIVASMESVSESMDWAVRQSVEDKGISTVQVVFLGWPWGWDDFKQMSGRFLRPGLAFPVEIKVLEGKDTVDQGFYNMIRLKKLYTQLVLSGIPLSPEESKFLEQSTAAERVMSYSINSGQIFLRNTYALLQGKGETQAIIELNRGSNGKSNFEHWTESYYANGEDEFRLVGGNAALVARMATSFQSENCVSIGAGTCLFSRKLASMGYQSQVSNVDINGAVLRLAKDKFPEIGEIITTRASEFLPGKSLYDFVDCSFMLPWTKLYDEGVLPSDNYHNIERVQILRNINEMISPKGHAVFTFPERSFDRDQFMRFSAAINNHFGFEVLHMSGMSYGIDPPPHRRIGWILTLEKRGEINLSGINLNDISFLSDMPTKILKGKNKNGGPYHEQVLVNAREAPMYSWTDFTVVDPATMETTTVLESVFPVSGVETGIDDEGDIKYKLSKQQLPVWNKCRKMIQSFLEIDYVLAEEILTEIFSEEHWHENPAWSDQERSAIVKKIEREIKHRKRDNTV